MKKFLAILLLIGIMLCTFAGCTSKDDPGTEINVYMGMADTFDPAMAYLDQDASNLLSLIYQGLFTVDAKGNLQKAMCKKYKVKGNVIEFTLNNTCWSDGTQVVAEDYVFAWKRLLDPEFQSEAASLLYYVENAIEVKNGDKYLDDVKIFAEGSIIHVELIDASYVDQFLYNCASVALFPLREDVISKLTLDEPFYDNAIDPVTKEPILAANKYLTSYSWATISAITVSCGPFYTKKIDLYPTEGNPSITLERNKYFYRDTSDTGDDAIRKYVDPFRINIYLMPQADAYAAYNAGTALDINDLPYLLNSNLPLEKRSASDTLNNRLATYSYFFNVENPLFEKAEVRNALSSVLDRNEIAKITVYGKAAKGIVSDGVFYTTKKTSFRNTAGDVIGATMSIDAAKSAISSAGGRPGSLTITVRNNETEIAVAEYVKSVWEKLGYTITIEPLANRSAKYFEVVGIKDSHYDVQAVYEGLSRDLYFEKYQSGEFDVIGVQLPMLSTDPFTVLCQFASKYSGNAYDFTESAVVFDLIKHITNYSSEEYNALIESYFTKKKADERAQIMLLAEKMLIKDAPLAPLYNMQSGFVSQSRLTGVKVDYYGNIIFTKAGDSTYKYEPVE